jgi:hypothetical protein
LGQPIKSFKILNKIVRLPSITLTIEFINFTKQRAAVAFLLVSAEKILK